MTDANPNPGHSDPSDEMAVLLLRGYDDPRSLHVPAGFDFVEATGRFLRLAHEVTRVVGEDCDVDVWPAVQDASFHGEVRLPESALVQPAAVSVRASNFGNLVTLYDADESVKPAVLAQLRRAFDRLGYRYIPSPALRRRYDGRHAGTASVRDWGMRFFGYV